jgi:hypothetical protein
MGVIAWQLLLRDGAAELPLQGVAASAMLSSTGGTVTGGNLRSTQVKNRKHRVSKGGGNTSC